MSIPVRIVELEQAVHERGSAAYVVTVDERGWPHVVQTCVQWDRDGLVAEVGERTARFAGTQPHVSLLYPSRSSEDYSLIVDGVATVNATSGSARLFLAPTRAVLHRPASGADPAPSACGSDCVPVALSAKR